MGCSQAYTTEYSPIPVRTIQLILECEISTLPLPALYALSCLQYSSVLYLSRAVREEMFALCAC